MSDKMSASPQVAPGKHGSDDKPRETPPGDQPTRRPGQKPVEVAPAPKS